MENARWLKEKATGLIEAKSYDEAVPYLERLLKTPGAGPFDLSFAHFMLGEIALYNSRFRSAQTHFKGSMEISGEDPQGLLMLGQAYLGGGKPVKAREVLEKARRFKADDEIVEMSLALAMCMNGEFEEAEEVYRRCLEMNPDRAEAHVGLAQALVGQDRLDDARSFLEESQRRLPMSLAIRRAMKELGKFEEARDFCDWLINENPDGITDELVDPEEEIMSWMKTLLVEYRFPPSAFKGAERLRRDFMRISVSLNIQMLEGVIGALVYTVARLHGRDDVSQKLLAERLNVSISTISNYYRRLSNELKISEGDKRYI